MKITIAYIADEQESASDIVAALRRTYPGIKVRKSERHPPFKHIYINSKSPGNHCNSRENT